MLFKLIANSKENGILTLITVTFSLTDEGETTVSIDTSEEIRKQYVTQIAELEGDTDKLKDNIQEQDDEIARLKQQIADLESRQPERVVETVVQHEEGTAEVYNIRFFSELYLT